MSELIGKTKSQQASAAAQATPDPSETTVTPDPRPDDAVVRRTKDGWRGGSADLISAELSAPPEAAAGPAAVAGATASAAESPGESAAAKDKARTKVKAKVKAKDAAGTETSRLRTTIGQLEHALTARIRVEQAIGVLAERHRIQPRQAFEQLRDAARSRGRRVIDIATDVVASATNPLLQLPDELSRPRAGGRRSRQTTGVLGSE